MGFSRIGILGVVVLLVGIVVAATAQEKAAEPAKGETPAESPKGSAAPAKLGAKTIIGEVIDPACWVINGAKRFNSGLHSANYDLIFARTSGR